MKEGAKQAFLAELVNRYGPIRKLGTGNSLFECSGNTLFYIRYSKLHGQSGFFGLDRKTLDSLRKAHSYVCFVLPPHLRFIIPFSRIADALKGARTAYDGSFKVQVIQESDQTWLRVPGKGRILITEFQSRFPPAGQRSEIDQVAEIYEAENKFTHGEIQRMMVRINANSSITRQFMAS